MPEKNKKPDDLLKHYAETFIRYSPLWIPAFILFLFFVSYGFSATLQFISLSRNIAQNHQYLSLTERSNADVAKIREDLEVFRRKVDEFESKLPTRIKTTLIIETLQEITRKSKLQFSSLEPLPIIRHQLKETGDVFVELPVKIKLNCSYYDLVEFIKRIETADQLMKITNLNIKDDPNFDWKHNIEFSVSAFSKGDGGE